LGVLGGEVGQEGKWGKGAGHKKLGGGVLRGGGSWKGGRKVAEGAVLYRESTVKIKREAN